MILYVLKFNKSNFLVSTLALLAQAGPTKASNLSKPCKSCSLDYVPVCAGPATGTEKPKSFGSVCVLDNYNCEKKTREI